MSQTYISADLRDLVAKEAEHRCGYCLTAEWIVGSPMEFDHIIPESLGGPTEQENLWLACSQCNHRKSNRIKGIDPTSGKTVRLFNPRRDAWNDHFKWAEGGELIVALTATGRATVAALDMNRPPIVIARRLWIRAGWHPPS